MSKAIILFADNGHDFLNIRAEFLEQAGYLVLKADTPVEARQLLAEARIHLAVLDIRMENDADEKDVSGLTLAKDPTFRAVPKIILTGFPTYQAVREALGPALDGLPPTVDFLAKQEGPEALIQAVERTFKEHVRINWDLAIHFAEAQSFYGWARQVTGEIPSEDILDKRAKEIEDLIRRTFYEYPDLTLDTIPTGRSGEVLAWIRSSNRPGRSLLKCSTPEMIKAERDRSRKWRVGLGWEKEPMQESVRFAVIVLPIPSDSEPVEWLAEYFHWHGAEEIVSAIEDFADRANNSIYRQECSQNERQSLNALYREQVGFTVERVPEEAFRRTLGEVVEYMRSRRFAAVDLDPDSGTITFHLKEGELICPDPTLYVYQDARRFDPPVFCRFTLGNMDGYNILVDRQGKTWVTDFAAIGPAPTLSDFIALESKIRFEWVSTSNLDQIWDFENQLSAIRSFEEPLEAIPIGVADLDKALRVLARLRQLAGCVPGADPLEYHFGILFRAARIIVNDAPPDRKVHALLGAAMICRSLGSE